MVKSYKLKNGEKRYKFQIYVGVDPLTGRERCTTRRGFKTQREARLERARLSLQIEDGTFGKKKVDTFHELYDLWVKQYEKTVEESTFVKTTTLFRNHILPTLGKYKVDKINVDICQKHVNEWATKLMNFRIVRSYAARVIDYAIKREYNVTTNPFDLVDMPIKSKKNHTNNDEVENFYTREELLKFLSCLEKENNLQRFAFFRLLAFSGMRKGEAFALTWSDINFKLQEIRINKALSQGKDNKLYVKSTKTGVARTIKIDEETLEVLKDWKMVQKERYDVLGYDTTKPEQLVFSNTHNKYIYPSKTYNWITHIQNKYNLPKVTTHGLRHTHISLLFEAGATIKEVQDRVGHTDVKTTMDIYTHLTEQAKEGTVQKFEDFMNPENHHEKK